MSQEGRNYSVLLVHKDIDDPHFLKKSLEDSRDFPSRIDLAVDIDDAFSKIRRKPYDLMLLESEFEEETMEVLGRIHEQPMPLPFVLLLPVKDEKLLREAIRCGVSDVIVKSESHFQQLAERLRRSYQAFERQAQPQKVQPIFLPENDFPEPPQREDPKAEYSVRDELTGLYSHSYLYERIVREFSAASRYNYPLSCVTLDIDSFAKINEDFGYFAGERLLKETAGLLFENCRMSDFIARFGGKSFCMVLPHSGYEGAKELAMRLRSLFSGHIFLSDQHHLQMTVSVGVSSYPEDPITQRGDLVGFAQEALQFAKASGRNRVALFKEIVHNPVEGFPVMEISEQKVLEFQKRMTETNSVFQRSLSDASKALILALEGKDKHTVGHSASTANYGFLLAKQLEMTPEEAEVVRLGTLLHDIGKICIPDNILLKPGRLTLAEFEIMKQHAYLGFKMLKPFRFLTQESLVVLHHHEWFNGEGYPCRLKGEEIPISARIAAVVDSYDTIRLAGARYKRTCTVADTVNELITCSGTQFDPRVVAAFIEVLKQRGEVTAEHSLNFARLQEILQALNSAKPPQEPRG